MATISMAPKAKVASIGRLSAAAAEKIRQCAAKPRVGGTPHTASAPTTKPVAASGWRDASPRASVNDSPPASGAATLAKSKALAKA